MNKELNQMSFSDFLPKRRLIVRRNLFSELNKIIDWSLIEIEIKKYYSKGYSVDCRPSYPGLVLFKMLLIGTWFNYSDYEVEEQVKDRISYSKFVGLSLQEEVPDHSVLSRFRTDLTKNKALDKLLNVFNEQLAGRKILVKGNGVVDASITTSPRKPLTKPAL